MAPWIAQGCRNAYWTVAGKPRHRGWPCRYLVMRRRSMPIIQAVWQSAPCRKSQSRALDRRVAERPGVVAVHSGGRKTFVVHSGMALIRLKNSSRAGVDDAGHAAASPASIAPGSPPGRWAGMRSQMPGGTTDHCKAYIASTQVGFDRGQTTAGSDAGELGTSRRVGRCPQRLLAGRAVRRKRSRAF